MNRLKNEQDIEMRRNFFGQKKKKKGPEYNWLSVFKVEESVWIISFWDFLLNTWLGSITVLPIFCQALYLIPN